MTVLPLRLGVELVNRARAKQAHVHLEIVLLCGQPLQHWHSTGKQHTQKIWIALVLRLAVAAESIEAQLLNTDRLGITKGEGLEDVTHLAHTSINEELEAAARAVHGDDLNDNPESGACHVELADTVKVP